MNWDTDLSPFEAELRWMFAQFNRRCTDTAVKQFWEALQDLEWEQFERGLQAVMREATALPRPIDIRRAVLGDRQESDREKQEAKERADLDDSIRKWKDSPQHELDKARFGRIRKHLSESLKGVHEFDVECESCEFALRHIAPHLHLRRGIVCGEANWDLRVPGCCAPQEEAVER